MITPNLSNAVTANTWQAKAKKYAKPALKLAGAAFFTTMALGFGRIAYGAGSILVEVVLKDHTDSPTADIFGIASAMVAIPSTAASLSSGILGVWLTKSAIDDISA